MYTSTDLERDAKSIVIEDFKWRKEVNGFSWTRKLDSKIESLVIGYRGYPDGYYLYTPHRTIRFDNVENILDKILNKCQITQSYGNYTIQDDTYPVKNIDYSKFDTEIHDEASFQIVAEEIKKIVENGALPFFEKYDTLKKVFEATEQMPIGEMANFIGQPLPQRRMVIKKLCHDPDYNEYVSYVIDYYKSEKDPDLFIIEKLNEYLNEEFG